MGAQASEQRNIVRYAFLHPAARELFDDWARRTPPQEPGLRPLWKRYDVKAHAYGHKTYHHPDVGTFTLNYQCMQREGAPGHRLVTYYAEPGTPSQDTLVLLDMTAYEPAEDEAGPQGEQSATRPVHKAADALGGRTPEEVPPRPSETCYHRGAKPQQDGAGGHVESPQDGRLRHQGAPSADGPGEQHVPGGADERPQGSQSDG